MTVKDIQWNHFQSDLLITSDRSLYLGHNFWFQYCNYCIISKSFVQVKEMHLGSHSLHVSCQSLTCFHTFYRLSNFYKNYNYYDLESHSEFTVCMSSIEMNECSHVMCSSCCCPKTIISV